MKRLLLVLALSGCTQEASPGNSAADTDANCTAPQRIAALPGGLREVSGLAVSRRHPGILWVHNDSGQPLIFALDTLGNMRKIIRIDAPNNDWEDIAVGSCPQGSCLYIGAIGDNRQNRTDREILRLPEPPLSVNEATVTERFGYRLPDHAHDTEALFVMPDERMYLITKGRSGPITLYRFPLPAPANAVSRLEAVQTLSTGLVQLPDMVTGAAATPDGRVIVIRSYSALQLYTFESERLRPLLAGTGVDLQPLREQQGEGIDITADGVIYLASEKGLEQADAPLSRLNCRLPKH